MSNLFNNYPLLTKRQGEAPGLKPSISRVFFFSNLDNFYSFSQYAMRPRAARFFLPALHSTTLTL